MEKDEAIALLKGNFGKEFLQGLMNYVTPISWSSVDRSGYTVEASGTAFLLDCGQGAFLVTAAHVFEGLVEAKKYDPSIRTYLRDIEFDFERRLISCLGSSTLDIATFSVTASEIQELRKQAAYGPTRWPPSPVTEHDGILFGGFPGRERRGGDPANVSFGLYVALTPASSSSARHFGCALEHDEWMDAFGNGLPEVGYDLGGVSGGPAFAFHESESGIVSWTIAGVIYNASTALGEIVMAHHIHFVGPDGSLTAPGAL